MNTTSLPDPSDAMIQRLILETGLYLKTVAIDPRYFVARDAASRIVRNSRRSGKHHHN